jgi:hypothetical protein
MYYYENGDCLLNSADQYTIANRGHLSIDTGGYRVDYFENHAFIGWYLSVV